MTGVRFSLKYLPIITPSALYISDASLVVGFLICEKPGDLPKSHRKLTSTMPKYMKKAAMSVTTVTIVFLYHLLPT